MTIDMLRTFRKSTWALISVLAGCAGLPPVLDTGHENMAGLTFSADGNSAYWFAWDGQWGSGSATRRTIFRSEFGTWGWSRPEPLPFSGPYSDDDPFVSPDGRWLYFISERPAHESDTNQDGDIWRYSLTDDDVLERLAINSDAAEYSPVLTASGALYFASARPGGPGQGDLYRAARTPEGFGEPVPLGPAINSPTGEWNLWVSPDESEMIFEASSRSTNISVPGDLYYSRFVSGEWTNAEAMTPLNSDGSDLLPRMHPDGTMLFYTTAPIGGHARIVPVMRDQSGQFGQLK